MKKQGLLVVSFGTSYPETREKTIGAIERDLAAAFPERAFYRAFTSGRIIAKIRREEGVEIDSLEEALARIVRDGITDLLAVPTHMIPAKENTQMEETLRAKREQFESLCVAAPLISGAEDARRLAGVLAGLFPPDAGTVVFMGHGAAGGSNLPYEELARALRECGAINLHLGLAEGSPGIEEIMQALPAPEAGPVTLTPMMVVAGDHALNDMSGGADSWEAKLQAAGYDTRCLIRGMGEYPEVRQLYVTHAKQGERW